MTVQNWQNEKYLTSFPSKSSDSMSKKQNRNIPFKKHLKQIEYNIRKAELRIRKNNLKIALLQK